MGFKRMGREEERTERWMGEKEERGTNFLPPLQTRGRKGEGTICFPPSVKGSRQDGLRSKGLFSSV